MFSNTRIFQRRLNLMLLLALLIFTAYSFMVQGSFKTMDDQNLIIDNDNIKSFSIDNIKKILGSSYFGGNSYYRPLILFNYMVEYHFWGLNPLYYYITNIFIHSASTFIVFLIIELIFGQRVIALFVALLFAIHPIHWEEISNISGRAILLSSFFYLSAFLLFCLADQKKRRVYYFLSMTALMLALLSKESAAVFPLLILAYQLFLAPQRGKFFNGIFMVTLPFWIIDLFYVLVRNHLGMTNLFYWRSPAEALLGFLTFLRGTVTYLRLFGLPFDLYFDRSRQVFTSFTDPELLLTVIFYIGLLGLIIKFRKKLPRSVLFFILWFYIELLPVSQFWVSIGVQPGYISLAEHFLYTSSVGIFVLMVLFFQWLYQKNITFNFLSKKIFGFGIGGLYLFLFIVTIQQNIYAGNEIAMFQRSLEVNPNNNRIRNSLAFAYANRKLFKEAEEHFRKVLAIDPVNLRARIGLGKALCDQGRYWEGVLEYDRVVDPGNLTALLENNLKLTYKILINQYKAMIQKNPQDPQTYYSLGVIYSKNNQIQEAIGQYTKTLNLDPYHKNALFNLASSYEAMGVYDKAIEAYERMINVGGEKGELDYHALIHLGEIYRGSGDFNKAKVYFEQAKLLPRKMEDRYSPINGEQSNQE